MSESKIDYLNEAQWALSRACNERDELDREWANTEALLSIANSLIKLAQALDEIGFVLAGG